MPKRFTETTKWDDAWFAELPANFKLAWLYACDCAGPAGVLDLSERLANFKIGIDVDWNAFVTATNGRIERLSCGKLWLTGFVDFQYGEKLSQDCPAHRPIVKELEKHGLSERVSKGYRKGKARVTNTLQDKDKEKEKDLEKDLSKGVQGETGDDWEFPAGWDCPEARQALDGFAAMRSRIRKPIRSKSSTSKIFKRFDSVQHLIEVAEICEANDWQGLKPEYSRLTTNTASQPKTFAQQRLDNTRKAAERFLANDSY